MPNHCVNFLEISDNEGDNIKQVIDAIEGERLIDFSKIIPYPERFAEMDAVAEAYRKEHGYAGAPKDGFNSGGYEWCIENWGTKWNAYKIEVVERDEYRIVIKFETAWSAPRPVIIKLAEMFPQYQFNHEWFERGSAFCGSAQYDEGELKYEAESEYYGFRGG